MSNAEKVVFILTLKGLEDSPMLFENIDLIIRSLQISYQNIEAEVTVEVNVVTGCKFYVNKELVGTAGKLMVHNVATHL